MCALAGAARADGKLAVYDDIDEHATVDVHGKLDVYAQAASDRTIELRAFDDSIGPALGLAQVTLAHHPDAVGFRVDAGAGDTAEAFLNSDPAKTFHPDYARAMSYLQQAFVTVVVPVGHGIALDAGKFSTPVGLEDNVAITNWNYSRSILFTFPEPTYHSGLRATYEPADDWTLQALWVDGWNTNFVDGNKMRSLGAAASWRPIQHLELVLDYVGGPERAPTHLADPTETLRNVVDSYAIYRATDTLELAASADWGHDARDAMWYGVAGYGRVRVQPWLYGALRTEGFTDPQGYVTGTPQRLFEVTATVEAHTLVHRTTVAGRLEFRADRSSAPVFDGSGDQNTLVLALLAGF